MPDTLLLLSGGIDSAFCLWKHLTEGGTIHIHHVHLKNHEGRLKYEAEAVKRILKWMTKQGLTQYTYTESTFDYGTLRFIVKDHNIWALTAGIILADPQNRSINKMIRPLHWDSFAKGAESAPAIRSERAYRNIIQQVSGRNDVELLYPIRQRMKAEIIREMPRDLLELCWYCRTPKAGKPCHKCYTCKLVDPAL